MMVPTQLHRVQLTRELARAAFRVRRILPHPQTAIKRFPDTGCEISLHGIRQLVAGGESPPEVRR
jgi:hypothetical protein